MKEVSRQRKWQIQKQKEGKCIICGKEAVNRNHCELHRKEVAKRNAEKYRRKVNAQNNI